MESTQRLPASLTPLESARDGLLQRLAAVTSVEVPLAEALGCIAAEMPALAAFPPDDIAVADGWALRARDLVGASSYTPLPLAKPPVWVEAGEAMPEGCDCVVDSDAIDRSGPMVQVLTDAIPGQGVRRIGGDIAAGSRCRGRPAPWPARSPGDARRRAESCDGAPSAAAHRQRSRDVRSGDDGRIDFGERPRRRRGSRFHRGVFARCIRHRGGARSRSMRSPDHDRRQRGRPQRCGGRGIGRPRPGRGARHRHAARPHRRRRPNCDDARHRAAGCTGRGAGGVVDCWRFPRSIDCRDGCRDSP